MNGNSDDRTPDDHTPGPWEAKRLDRHHWVIGEVARTQVPSAGGAATIEANARLIAAAPDLYAALNEIHGEFDRQLLGTFGADYEPHDLDEFTVMVTFKQLQAINAAILKAERKL